MSGVADAGSAEASDS